MTPFLIPEVIEKAEQGRRFVAGEVASLAVGDLMLVATVLAVFKPWGRIRKRPATRRGAP